VTGGLRARTGARWWGVLAALVLGLAGCRSGLLSPTRGAAVPRLILATTTSTADSGLLDAILPAFEETAGVEVDVIAVGSGQAIALGEAGDADVLLVHDPDAEAAFMAAGHGTRREPVMANDFVVVGPENDPAAVAATLSAVEAFRRIAGTQAPFISRCDNSGTHAKELALWRAAGTEPAGGWYICAGQGMGETLTLAEEARAYTLSDRATYLARTRQGMDLVVLVEGDPLLLNPYSVIAVKPGNGAHSRAHLADQFIEWLISVETQKRIAAFGVEEFGQSLFFPDSLPWHAAQ
jgi:tungstate transport system substrate-binding protein